MRRNKRSKLVLLTAMFAIFVAFCTSSTVVYAAGGWISGGSAGTATASGGGGGGGGCSGDSWYYDLWCTGYSWVFYKYVGGESNKRGINFRRDGYMEDFGIGKVDNPIDRVCSEHGESGGFWHLGYNMRGIRGYDVAVLNDWRYVKGLEDENKNLYYSTGFSKVGHAMTFDYGSIPKYYSGKYKIYDDSTLDHTIYWRSGSTYTPLYKAERFGTEKGVFEDFKAAYKAAKGEEYTGSSLPSNVYAFCWWPGLDEGSSFEGRTAVQKTDNVVSWNDAVEKNRTHWIKKGNEKVDLEIECDDDNGCDVSFRHFIKRTSGSDGTKYTITRTVEQGSINSVVVSSEGHASNWGVNADRVTSGEVASNVNLSSDFIEKNTSNDGWVFLGKSAIKMKAGDKVCETLEFVANNETGEKASTTACATVKAKEVDAEEEKASIKIDVKNNDVSKYDYGVGRFVFAKPGDTVSYRVNYNPAPQSIYEYCRSNSDKCRYELSGVNNYNITGIDGWKNAFRVNAVGFDYSANKAYNNGLDAEIIEEINSHEIGANDVGKELYEYALIDPLNVRSEPIASDEVWFTPIAYQKVGDEVTVEVGQLISGARVVIPYNFETSVEVQDVGAVYAGENTNVKYSIGVVEKSNLLTTNSSSEMYKTKIKNPKVKTVVYYGDKKDGVGSYAGESDGGVDVNLCGYFGGEKCKESDVQAYTNPSTGENVLVNEGSGSIDVAVPDVAAGTKICVAAAIYPANSGNDGNISEAGSDTWRISDSKCLTVAKKPSFQVWGGSVYSGGDIKAPLAKKTDLAGYSWDGEMRMFGSWAEWSVVHNGSNLWLASGAGLGYVSNNNGTLWPVVHPDDGNGNISNNDKGSGGNSGDTFCNVSTLTFPNDDCNISISGVSSGGGGSLNIDIDEIKETIENIQGVTEVSGGEIEGSVVYFSGSDITISGDIKLKDDASYTSLDAMPKVIIYAGGSININPNVERIDAVLIAKSGDIDTCSIDEDNQSYSKDCSRQLSINGALIAGGEVKFNRTYGAATGANSMVPAEIINYNPALYFLKIGGSSTSSQSTIWEQVYTRELAPRY